MQDFKENETITFYDGTRFLNEISRDAEALRRGKDCYDKKYLLHLPCGTCVDGDMDMPADAYGAYVNHCCAPGSNAMALVSEGKRIRICAKRTIQVCTSHSRHRNISFKINSVDYHRRTKK